MYSWATIIVDSILSSTTKRSWYMDVVYTSDSQPAAFCSSFQDVDHAASSERVPNPCLDPLARCSLCSNALPVPGHLRPRQPAAIPHSTTPRGDQNDARRVSTHLAEVLHFPSAGEVEAGDGAYRVAGPSGQAKAGPAVEVE